MGYSCTNASLCQEWRSYLRFTFTSQVNNERKRTIECTISWGWNCRTILWQYKCICKHSGDDGRWWSSKSTTSRDYQYQAIPIVERSTASREWKIHYCTVFGRSSDVQWNWHNSNTITISSRCRSWSTIGIQWFVLCSDRISYPTHPKGEICRDVSNSGRW